MNILGNVEQVMLEAHGKGGLKVAARWREGYSVETALPGDPTILKIDEVSYDAVISDVKMPGRGGTHVLLHSKGKNRI